MHPSISAPSSKTLARTVFCLFGALLVQSALATPSGAQGPLVTSSGQLAGYKIHYPETPDYVPGDPTTFGAWKVDRANLQVKNNGTIVGFVVWAGRDGQLTPPPGGTFPWHREAFVYDIAADNFQFVKDLVAIPDTLTDYYPELFFYGSNNSDLYVGMLRRADGIVPSEAIPVLIDLNTPASFELLPTPNASWVENGTVPSAGGAAINDFGDVLIRFRSKTSSPSGAGFMWNYYTSPSPKLVAFPSTHSNSGQPILFGPGHLHEMNNARQFVGINDENGETFRITFSATLDSTLYEADQFSDVVEFKHNGVNESGSFVGRMNRLVVVPGKGKKTKTELRQVPFIYTDSFGLETLPSLGETWGKGHDLNETHDVIGQLDDLDPEHNAYEVYRRFLYHDGFASLAPALHMLEGSVVPASLNPDSEHLDFWDASDGAKANAMHMGERIDIDFDGIGDYPIVTGRAAVSTTTTTGKGKHRTTTTTWEERWFILVPDILP